MKIERFEDIESWKVARELTRHVYSLCNKGQLSRDYGLKDQVQRASVSIMANIAEGFDSNSSKSFLNFLSYSFRSASEVQSLLYVILDLNYITPKEFEDLYNQSTKIKSLIMGLSRYLKTLPE
ncbi:MAG: four helix bundle protein [Ignavibacteria bacterium]|jgi:four helix bundle protein|nr:four helix bundle protein [Ignavibacteria bacterium]MCU7501342.1 four helix bundle protein [Ignavibacteria bacterium]MCU7520971.1 four helix bundle protein [Ignavibacteria bacterium]MCU7526058.1 four helix bundle protein [Ignavibacteria bacterium]